MTFLRRIWYKYSKLGKRNKKKRVWRYPGGRDNPMREKRRGYPVIVSRGYMTNKETKGKINGKNPVTVRNLKDLEKVKKNEIIILAKIGMKNKIQIVSKAKEKGLEIQNLNIKKFLKKIKEKK
ncbi:MAG TPA: eL32 family ribosomal protein [Candidatus Nanoarchaeia archaeon]|nr:eL32 family ribosomal protein [Candidatus Nanoarchaeia archaeon]